jgi:hypothetical protein
MFAYRVAAGMLCLLAAGCGSGDAGDAPAPAPEFTAIVPEPSQANLAMAAECPFRAADWSARAAPLGGAGGRLDVELSGNVRATGPASPLIEPLPGPTPPVLVFELRPGDFPAERGATRVAATVSPYNAAFTSVAVHCAGREIARLPIRIES